MQADFASPPSRVVVLVGIPGSGKSTLAARLAESGWITINQVNLTASFPLRLVATHSWPTDPVSSQVASMRKIVGKH